MEPEQAVGRFLFLGNAVVLQLQIKVFRSEGIPEPQRPLPRRGILIPHQISGDFPRQTARQANQALCVGGNGIPIRPGFHVKSVNIRLTDNVAQIVVSGFVFAQQNQMGVLIVHTVHPVRGIPRCNIDLAPDDRVNALRLTLPEKIHGAVHDAMIRNCQCCLTHLLCPGNQLRNPAGTVQQRIFTMYMQMSKCHAFVPLSKLFPPWTPAASADDSGSFSSPAGRTAAPNPPDSYPGWQSGEKPPAAVPPAIRTIRFPGPLF